MKLRHSYPILQAVVFSLTLSFVLTNTVFSQDLPKGVVPPPLTKLSKETLKLLDSEKSVKSQTKLAIDLMEKRLMASSAKTKNKQFENALVDVGRFRGLMFHMKEELLDRKSKPSLRSNKRFEIALRKFVPELQKLRRGLPYRYSYHVKRLIEDLQDIRGDLLDSFFGDADV